MPPLGQEESRLGITQMHPTRPTAGTHCVHSQVLLQPQGEVSAPSERQAVTEAQNEVAVAA